MNEGQVWIDVPAKVRVCVVKRCKEQTRHAFGARGALFFACDKHKKRALTLRDDYLALRNHR